MKFSTPGARPGYDCPVTDVGMRCCIRLDRNSACFPSVGSANHAQRREILKVAQRVVLSTPLAEGMFWVDLGQSSTRDRQLLMERHLISRHLAEADFPRGVAVSGDETLSIMVNEEDHLRLQVLGPGLGLDKLMGLINEVDDAIESKLDFAFSRRWGYLTACPTNVGAGIRLSVMMHLPGVKLTGEIDRVRRAATNLHLAGRGSYGDGAEAAGHVYQDSSKNTRVCAGQD